MEGMDLSIIVRFQHSVVDRASEHQRPHKAHHASLLRAELEGERLDTTRLGFPQVSSKGSEEQKMVVADLQQKLKKSQDEVQRHMLEAQIRCLADL